MINGTKILNDFIEQYKTNQYNALDNMKSFYNTKDERWFVIQELLKKITELENTNNKIIELKNINDKLSSALNSSETKQEKIKFYVEQSNIKDMLWGKEMLEIIEREEK